MMRFWLGADGLDLTSRTYTPKGLRDNVEESRRLLDPLFNNNPIAFQVLGICSALAVTTKLENDHGDVLGGDIAVLVGRISRQPLAQQDPAFDPHHRSAHDHRFVGDRHRPNSQGLSSTTSPSSCRVFVGLIITNCIVMGRAEAYAMQNGPFPSLMDALGNAAGYSLILLGTAFLRELFGSGKLFGGEVMPLVTEGGWYNPNGLMVLSPGAFFIIGIFIWAIRIVEARAGRGVLSHGRGISQSGRQGHLR